MNAKDLKNILATLPDGAYVAIEIYRNKKLDSRSHIEEVIIDGDMKQVTIVGEFNSEE